MSSFEPDAVNQKLLEQALTDALHETAEVLDATGASTEERTRVARAFAPVLALVRGTVSLSIGERTPAQIEQQMLEPQPSNVVSMVGRIAAAKFKRDFYAAVEPQKPGA